MKAAIDGHDHSHKVSPAAAAAATMANARHLRFAR